MNATGPNGPIGMDASHSDRSEGVSFSWDDGVLNEIDGNEADGNEVDGNETDGNEEARDKQHENGADENEADLVDGDVISKKTGQVFFDSSTAHPRFELGTIFENSQQFKEALYAYAVGNRFDFKFVSNKKEKVRVVCKGKGCPFVVHASRDKSDGCFKVKTLVTDHNCSVTFKNSRANFKFVGKHFISKLRILLTLRLWDYVNTLRAADVRGTFDLVVERPNVTDIPKFRRIYVCFSALREGFKMYCRPVVGLDGCFLKGSFKGEILSAVGRDCNNQIFPIAWAVVEVENRETWAWFLNNLQHDIGFGDGDGCTLLSDMQKVCLKRYHFASQKLSTDFVLGICMPIGEKFTKEVTCRCCSGSAARQQHNLSLQIASEQFWKDSGMGKIDPPLHRKMPGRPKHKRRREEGEVRGRTKLRKLGSKLSCRLCGGIGHNVRTCPKKIANVENHGPSPTPSAPPSSQTSQVPPSSQIPSPPSSQTSHVPPSSQISSPPSSQTSHVPPSSQIPSAPQSTPQSTSTMPGRSSQVVLSRPHTRSFTKPTSQPNSTTATSPVAAPVLLSRPHTRSFTKPTSQPTSTSTTVTPPVVAPVSASSGSDATATVSPEERLPKLTIKRHPPKN
ncbi:hypothetical protein V6N13_039149 [Hibiscus sabdariffa]